MADYTSQFTGPEIDARLAAVPNKQDALVSGSNIKTVNGQSVLGPGNIEVQAGDADAVKYVSQTLTEAQKTQARTNIGSAAAAALSALETAIAAKYSKPSGGIPETDLASAVQSALALARTSIQSLADYYSKTEVDALLAAVGSEQYVDVTTLPTASASTLGKIYLVGPDANGFYDRYYTSYDGSTYSWVPAGNTEINLANYATKTQVSQLEAKVDDTFHPDSEPDTLYIADTNGNVIGKIDADGLSITDVNVLKDGNLVSILTLLADKVDKDGTKVLSDENFTSELKDKLDSLKEYTSFDEDTRQDAFYIADSDGNALARFDRDGLKTTKIDAHHLNGSNIKLYEDKLLITDKDGFVVCMIDKNGVTATKINSLDVLKNSWAGKVMATYGDSITAVNNGDFSFPFTPNEYNWGNEVAKFFSFAKNYGRGIGSTCFKYRDHGGQVAWVNTVTGNYVDRNDSYTYDNYEGHVTIPSGCTAIRGDGSSWLRLTTMFPASIRGTIDVVMVMFHNDFHYDMDTDVVWIPNDTTDPEWAASDEYSALGGDYNIASVKGGIASVVMKLQALMPQATIVLMTPIGGVYTSSGEKSGNFNNEETAKMKKLADVVMDVAQRMSTPCINVYGTCGINTLNRTTYISDTIHPYTVAGRKKIGRAVSSGLIQQISL